MGARADLLAAAAGLAENARSAAASGEHTAPDFTRAAQMATAAKTALEAAALAENTGSGQIDEALSHIQDLLEEAGVLAESMELSTAEFLDRTFRALLAWRGEALSAQGYEVGYDMLRDLVEGLERDWVAADSDVSRRLAGRARARLDEATAVINHGKQGSAHGDQDES